MKKIKQLIKMLGPGFITGASDDDPSGIGTYAQTGALFGFSQAWTALFSFPLMTAVQEMCGRIGLVTGKGLAGVIKTHYSQKLLYVCVGLLFFANTINIGADLGAMAASIQLLVPVPFMVLVVAIVAVTLGLEIFFPYRVYASYLKFLALALFCYVAAALFINIDWQKVLISTMVPSFFLSREYVMNIVAIFGTTISPYLFFWQASEEVEEEVKENHLRVMGQGIPVVTKKEITKLRTDTIAGMFFSNLIMFFIIITTAATLFPAGIHAINSADEAASALRPIAGEYAFFLFALGIVGTGLLAVPVLAGSASYAVSETFGWREGLYRKFSKAHGFYGAIGIATIVGLLINFLGINPMLFLYYTAVINGLIAPVLLVVIVIIANNKEIMKGRTNGLLSNILSIITAVIMSVASIMLIFMSFV